MYLYILPVLNEDFVLNPTCFQMNDNDVLHDVMQCVNQTQVIMSPIIGGLETATVPDAISIYKRYISSSIFLFCFDILKWLFPPVNKNLCLKHYSSFPSLLSFLFIFRIQKVMCRYQFIDLLKDCTHFEHSIVKIISKNPWTGFDLSR